MIAERTDNEYLSHLRRKAEPTFLIIRKVCSAFCFLLIAVSFLTGYLFYLPAAFAVPVEEEWSIQQNAVDAATCNAVNRICGSLSSWEDAADGTGARDLVADDKIVVAKIDGAWTNPDTTPVIINGWTTDATHYIKIYATSEARHSGKWDDGKYVLRPLITADYQSAIRIEEENVRIEGLQIDILSSYSNNAAIGNFNLSSSINDVRISSNIIRASFGGSMGIGGDSNKLPSGTIAVWNNIVYGFSAVNAHGIIVYTGSSANGYIYNNTVANSYIGIRSYGSGDVAAKNNLSYGNTNLNYYGIFNSFSSNNLSGPTKTDAPGLNPKNAATVTFIDANNDFHLSLLDVSANDTGVDVSLDLNLSFSDDIDENPRLDIWDIGADESVKIYQCSDALDNDGDGSTDYPNDSDCVSASDNSEFNDLFPPSIPSGLSATNILSTRIDLIWGPSIDTGGSGLKGYKIYRCSGISCIPAAPEINTSMATTYSDATGLAPNTSYAYAVSAYDANGNESGQSEVLTVVTNSTASKIYYMAPPTQGNDTNNGSLNYPFATFTKAFSVMSFGDTLIVKDGTYNQSIAPTLSGTAGNPITIKAENDGGVTLDGGGVQSGIFICAKQYSIVAGFISVNPGVKPAISVGANDGDFTSSNNIIIRRTGGRGGAKDTNNSVWNIDRTSDSLLEDVWGFGDGRYVLNVYGSTNVTVRRAVLRWDRWDGLSYKPDDPRFNLGVYNTHNSFFENILLIDAGVTSSTGDKGALLVPGNNNGNTSPYIDSDNNKFYGMIALNNIGDGISVQGGSGTTNDNNIFKDVVVWGNSNFGVTVNNKADGTIFGHITLGKNSYGTWFNPYNQVTNSIIKNSLITGHTSYGLRGVVTSDYNNVFSNNPDYYQYGPPPGVYDISQNPQVQYILRLESMASGKGTADDGGDRSGTVEKRYIDGLLTSEPLWP